MVPDNGGEPSGFLTSRAQEGLHRSFEYHLHSNRWLSESDEFLLLISVNAFQNIVMEKALFGKQITRIGYVVVNTIKIRIAW